MRLRSYRATDAPALCDLYRRSVLQLGPRKYDAAQVAAWASLTPTPDALHRDLAGGHTVIVAVDADDRPVAFADMETDGHIGRFYLAPEVAGTGLAGRLYSVLEITAIGRRYERMFLEASEVARSFFESRGFLVLSRRDLTIGDVSIHNYAMEKRLGSEA